MIRFGTALYQLDSLLDFRERQHAVIRFDTGYVQALKDVIEQVQLERVVVDDQDLLTAGLRGGSQRVARDAFNPNQIFLFAELNHALFFAGTDLGHFFLLYHLNFPFTLAAVKSTSLSQLVRVKIGCLHWNVEVEEAALVHAI